MPISPLIVPVLLTALGAPPEVPAPIMDAPPPVQAGPESGVSKERMADAIRALPTKRSSWGSDAHAKGLRATEAMLAARLKDLGYTPTLDPIDFIGHRVQDHEEAATRPYNNIIVDLPGTTAKDHVLVLSAHMDAVPAAPGADDDGSGVAVLLEAARLLKDRPMQRSVRLILFNLEENGLVGSRAYTLRIKPDLDAGKEPIVGMISMDMLGFYSDAEGSQQSPLQSVGSSAAPTVGDFVAMAGILRFRPFSQALDRAMKEAEPRLKTVVVDFLPVAPPDLLRSDHAPFIGIGVPAVLLTDTANYRNPNYHKAGDTFETLDMDRLTIAARGVIGGVYRLAGPPGTELIDIAPVGGSARPRGESNPETPVEAKPDARAP